MVTLLLHQRQTSGGTEFGRHHLELVLEISWHISTRMKSGIDLFMSDATLNSLSSDDDPRGWERHLRSKASSLGRCQALLDFVLFDKPHTGEEVGAWLDHAHGRVQCKPSFIGSHVVDGAGYAGASVEELKWTTTDERSTSIVTDKCTVHQANTSATRASGTSGHKVNLNPELGKSLTLLHSNLTRLTNSGVRKKVYTNVGKERGRTKSVSLSSACQTRWTGEPYFKLIHVSACLTQFPITT